eukprot:9283728-Pyramimonas_sp.AAC.1
MFKHDSPSQNSSKHILCEPHKACRTFFGGLIGKPGRVATACIQENSDPQPKHGGGMGQRP